MNPTPLSFWDQAQLTFLRMLSAVLGMVDDILHVHWGERLLQRLTDRWQAELKELDQALARLEEERHELQMQVGALSLQAATIYLGERKLTRSELCFDPADPRDEEILDVTIDLLVKERLATIESQEIEPGHHVYHLEPDWEAIRTSLSTAAERAQPDIAEWLCEGVRFIDGELLPGSKR
jgi:hypothetical protein